MPISEYVRKIRSKIGKDLLISPGAAGIVINEKGEILLQLRSDTGEWGIPGGAIEPGEEPAETVVREVFEETGIHVLPERILAVLSGEDHIHTYPNGDQTAIVSITFLCRPIGGELGIDNDESLDVRYFAPDALPENMMERHRLRIEIALRNEVETYFRK